MKISKRLCEIFETAPKSPERDFLQSRGFGSWCRLSSLVQDSVHAFVALFSKKHIRSISEKRKVKNEKLTRSVTNVRKLNFSLFVFRFSLNWRQPNTARRRIQPTSRLEARLQPCIKTEQKHLVSSSKAGAFVLARRRLEPTPNKVISVCKRIVVLSHCRINTLAHFLININQRVLNHSHKTFSYEIQKSNLRIKNYAEPLKVAVLSSPLLWRGWGRLSGG